jgi:hypothetical protein
MLDYIPVKKITYEREDHEKFYSRILTSQIRRHGLLQPLIVKGPTKDIEYIVLDGRRRLASLQELAETDTRFSLIPCMVHPLATPSPKSVSKPRSKIITPALTTPQKPEELPEADNIPSLLETAEKTREQKTSGKIYVFSLNSIWKNLFGQRDTITEMRAKHVALFQKVCNMFEFKHLPTGIAHAKYITRHAEHKDFLKPLAKSYLYAVALRHDYRAGVSDHVMADVLKSIQDLRAIYVEAMTNYKTPLEKRQLTVDMRKICETLKQEIDQLEAQFPLYGASQNEPEADK